ncbi:hypothetical protein [Streptomyces sp. AP-93]|uniref:hypothetical protein n=1 Tax=Streptomyces sp. AP-93 TaxID=2929048 RepID=UPI001FAF3636|nr:hypothetical protein [Streptomyces sp. AP-93]
MEGPGQQEAVRAAGVAADDLRAARPAPAAVLVDVDLAGQRPEHPQRLGGVGADVAAGAYRLVEEGVRITIGTPDANDRLLKTATAWHQ